MKTTLSIAILALTLAACAAPESCRGYECRSAERVAERAVLSERDRMIRQSTSEAGRAISRRVFGR